MPSLIVPVAQWGHRPPQHAITAIHVARQQRVIVTGSATGPIVLWDFEPGVQERLRVLEML